MDGVAVALNAFQTAGLSSAYPGSWSALRAGFALCLVCVGLLERRKGKEKPEVNKASLTRWTLTICTRLNYSVMQ